MKVRCIYTKTNNLKYISHLDTVNLIQRAIFSTNVKIQFSEGYNPHPKMSFGNPLPLGVSSSHEVFDINLEEEVDTYAFMSMLNEYLPKDVQIVEAFEANEKSISEMYTHALYNFQFYYPGDIENNSFIPDGEFYITKKVKTKKKGKGTPEPTFTQENIIEHIHSIGTIKKVENEYYSVDAVLENSYLKIINPNNFIIALFKYLGLEIERDDIEVHKKEMLKY